MRKITMMVVVLVCTMMVTAAFAVTFPVASQLNMSVKMEGQDVVVIVDGQEDQELFLIQYFQDNLRPMNKPNQRIAARVSTPDHKEFVLQSSGVRWGQVAFNFKSADGRWMGLPTCLITLNSGLAWGDSKVAKDIDESGGALIVMTATGIIVQYPLGDLGCGGEKNYVAKVTRQAVTQSTFSRVERTTAQESAVATNVKSPSAMAASAVDSALSQVKAGVVEVHAKNVKGNVTTTTKIKQWISTNAQRGSTMKRSKVIIKGNNSGDINCTRNINITVQKMGNYADSENSCTACHNNTVWSAIQQKGK